MDVYLIIGEANTGKSSLMRCLTGASMGTRADRGECVRLKLLDGRVINVYIDITAAQEIHFTPEMVIEKVKERTPDADAVMITLRENASNNCPNAVEYIKAFKKANWIIKKTVLLDIDFVKDMYGEPLCLCGVSNPSNPLNRSAQRVRTYFEFV